MNLSFGWIILVVICAIPITLYLVYVLTRVVTKATLRSFWETKSEFEKRKKEEK